MADLICFSHLRWDFVFQRPQHLMTRAARGRRVFFVEEPHGEDSQHSDGTPFWRERDDPDGVRVCVPHLPHPDLARPETVAQLRELLRELIDRHGIEAPVLWHYTPMFKPVTEGIEASAIVYDCMDELSAFRFAPTELLRREAALLSRADLVFTGGRSLYEAKLDRHPNVSLFPSSVDVEHWQQARGSLPEPADLANISHPRLGYVGVIDERMDLELLRTAAEARPDWHWLLLGPVVKIDPATLPQGPNVHALGMKRYDELPGYLAHWDVALMPFALNESTRFISPTKTPEYLAAGLPVVSTPIRDVVRTYGDRGLVHIADGPDAFIAACERALAGQDPAVQSEADALLQTMSWDATWQRMDALIHAAVERNGDAGEARARSGAKRAVGV